MDIALQGAQERDLPALAENQSYARRKSIHSSSKQKVFISVREVAGSLCGDMAERCRAELQVAGKRGDWAGSWAGSCCPPLPTAAHLCPPLPTAAHHCLLLPRHPAPWSQCSAWGAERGGLLAAQKHGGENWSHKRQSIPLAVKDPEGYTAFSHFI